MVPAACILLSLALGVQSLSLLRAPTKDNQDVSESVYDTLEGPMVMTMDGPINGRDMTDYNMFVDIPYAEPPERFAKSVLKQPWAGTLDATGKREYKGCWENSLNHSESDDCLTLIAWVPKGGKQRLPVVIYMRGGVNQRGSSHEPDKTGQGIAVSQEHPTIFINFDYRLGIFGWGDGGEGSDHMANLGFMDQQLLFRWVQRNIGAFGGDPQSVTLLGSSEGNLNILAHMVSPGSFSLFHRVVLASIPRDMFSHNVNHKRTVYIAKKVGCANGTHIDFACLKLVDPHTLIDVDWRVQILKDDTTAPEFETELKKTLLYMAFSDQEGDVPLLGRATLFLHDVGWHAGEGPETPRELIDQGRWNKVPILMTFTENETKGLIPESLGISGSIMGLTLLQGLQSDPIMLRNMTSLLNLASGDVAMALKYAATLPQHKHEMWTNFTMVADDLYEMTTDYTFICPGQSFAKEISRQQGEVHVGVFARGPPVHINCEKASTSCYQGGSCHEGDVQYLIGDDTDFRLRLSGVNLSRELALLSEYKETFLAFVHGQEVPWKPYDAESQAVTFWDENGFRVVNKYRSEQCAVLDEI